MGMWRNWHTRTTQNRMSLARVGSTPTMPTSITHTRTTCLPAGRLKIVWT